MADLKSLGLDAIDAWFQDKIKVLAENHHFEMVGKNNNTKATAVGVELAHRCRDEMRVIVTNANLPAI